MKTKTEQILNYHSTIRGLAEMAFGAERFRWEGKKGYAEASQFFRPGGFGFRIYADACDEGFYVRSPRTGKLMLFLFERLERAPGHPEEPGEIHAAHYQSVDDPQITITLFND